MNPNIILSMTMLSVVELAWDKMVDPVTDGIGGFFSGILTSVTEGVAAGTRALIELVVIPPAPPGALDLINSEYSDVTGGLISGMWGEAGSCASGIIALNCEMTTVALALFPLVLLLYILGAAVGFIEGDFGEHMFKIFLAYLFIVANRQILNIFYAAVTAISYFILDSTILVDSGVDMIVNTMGSILATLAAGAAVSLGYGVTIAIGFVLAVVIIMMLMFAVHIIGMIGYGIFPLLIITYMLGELFDIFEQKHQAFVGFFIPPIYSPILYAIIFKVAAFFATGFGFGGGESKWDEGAGGEVGGDVSVDASAAAGDIGANFVEGIIGPVLFLFILIGGFFFVLMNMKAGKAVVGAAKTVGTAAVGGAMVAASGGAGAASAAKGAARGSMHGGGVRNMASGAIFEMSNDDDVDTNITGGALETAGNKISDLNEKGSVAGATARGGVNKLRQSRLGQSVGRKDADELADDVVTDQEKDVYDQEEISDEKGEELFAQQYGDQVERAENGDKGMNEIKGYLQDIASALEDQNSIDDADEVGGDLKDTFEQRAAIYEASGLDREEANARAMDDAINQNDDIESKDLATLAYSRKMADNGYIRSNNEIPNDIYTNNEGVAGELDNMDDGIRHDYIRNQFSRGVTTEDPVPPEIDIVELDGVSQGDENEKNQAFGFEARGAPNRDANDGEFALNEVDAENGVVKFDADGSDPRLDNITNPDERDEGELEFDMEEGQWVMDADAFDEAVEDVDFGSIDDATADRQAMMDYEQINRESESEYQQEAREQIQRDLGSDSVMGSFIDRMAPTSSRERAAEESAERISDEKRRRRDSQFKAADEGVEVVNPGQIDPAFTQGDSPDVDDLYEEELENLDRGSAVGEVSDVDMSNGGFNVTTSSGKNFSIDIQDSIIQDQLESRFEDDAAMENKNIKIDKAQLEENAVGDQSLVIDSDSQIEVEPEVRLDSESENAYGNVGGVGTMQLEGLKKQLSKEAGDTDTQLQGLVANSIKSSGLDGTIDKLDQSRTPLTESQAKEVINITAANVGGEVDTKVVEQQIDHNIQDTDLRSDLKREENLEKMASDKDVSVSDLNYQKANENTARQHLNQNPERKERVRIDT